MKTKHLSPLLPAALSLSLLAAVAQADDWPQWRGPTRDGVWHETGILKSFPRGGLKIAWRAPLGPGFSSPVVASGQVYVTDSQISRRKAQERVLSFDARTGRTRWTHSYEVDYADWAFDPKNPFGPRATPVVSANKVYTLGARGHLICFQTGDGKIVWEKHIGNKNKDSAFTPSPLIHDDFLILVLDGAPAGPCLVAVDKNTGIEAWNALDEMATMSSPVLVEVGGNLQLIVWTRGSVNSLDPATGKVHWRQRHLGFGDNAIPTPVARHDLLWVNGVMFRLTSARSASVLWPDGRPAARPTTSETSSAYLQGRHLFTCNMSGELICIEALTGKIVWTTNQVTDAKSGGSIHITANGDSAFLFNDKGELVLAELRPTAYKEISRTALLKPTFPHGGRRMAWVAPAYADRHVFARSDEELVCATLAGQ